MARVRLALLLVCLGAWTASLSASAQPQAASEPALGEATVVPARKGPPRVEQISETGQLNVLGTPLESQIALAYGFHPLDLVFRMSLPRKTLLDVRARPADRRHDSALHLIRNLLARHFGFEANPILRNTHVAVLRPIASWPALEPSTAATSVQQRRGRFAGTGVPISTLVAFVRSVARQPIVDETGLGDRYDLVLEWDASSEPYALVQAFEDIGLEMIFEKREVPFLVVRSAQ